MQSVSHEHHTLVHKENLNEEVSLCIKIDIKHRLKVEKMRNKFSQGNISAPLYYYCFNESITARTKG